MSKDVKKILKPSLPASLNLVNGEALELDDEYTLVCSHVKGGYIEEKNSRLVYFKECLFENVTFSDINFDGLEIINCVFKSCDFSGIRAIKSNVHKSEFIDCKMSGTIFSESIFSNVSFKDIIGNYFTSRFSEFKNTFFENCNMVSCDLQDSKFSKVYIENSDISSSNFLGVKLKGLDLRSNKIENISTRIEDVKGAKIGTMQVFEFAKLLELRIED